MRYLAATVLALILAVACGVGAKAVFFNNLAVSGGVAPPAPPPVGGIVFNPTSVTFASQAAGTSSSPVAVTAQNIGAGSLTVSSVNLTGSNPGDFSLTNNCGVLAPSGSCTVNVTYHPGAAGSSAATVALTADVTPPSSTPTITVNGSPSGASVAAGATISVAVANGSANSTDWIGLCSSSTFNHANCDAQFDWDYLGSPCSKTQPSSGLASATCSMTAPASGGPYVAAFFQSGSYSAYASAPFTVTGGAPPAGCSADGTAGTRDMSQYPNGTGTATLDWASCRQVVDGWGADIFDQGLQPAWFTLTSGELDDLFTLNNGGIGLNIARLDDFLDQRSAYGSPTDSPPSIVSNVAECPNVSGIASRGGKIFSMHKQGPNQFNTGGGALVDFTGFATWEATFAAQMQSQCGVPLYAASIMNEPDIGNSNINGSQMDTITKDMAAAYASAGNSTTKIGTPDQADWNFDFATATMNDSAAAPHVGLLMVHYGNTVTPHTVAPYPYQNLGLHLWHTEASDIGTGAGWGDAYGPLWNAYAVSWYFADGDANAYVIMLGKAQGSYPACSGLLCNVSGRSKWFYLLGQYSRVVRPGWHLYGATENPINGQYVAVTFWRSPSTNQFAIVAVNFDGGTPAVTFSFSGFTAPNVTPFLTDQGSNNMAQQSAITAGSGFTTTLPAQSVTTFTGTAN